MTSNHLSLFMETFLQTPLVVKKHHYPEGNTGQGFRELFENMMFVQNVFVLMHIIFFCH